MHVRTDGLTDRQNDQLLSVVEQMRKQNAVTEGQGGHANQLLADRNAEKASPVNEAAALRQLAAGSPAYRSEEVSLENVDDVMRYQPWTPDQVAAGDIVREALTAAVRAILRQVPRCPSRTKAVNHLVDARMDANTGISFRGRF